MRNVRGTLEEFTLEAGETAEQALNRCIDWHIADHRFTEILAKVNELIRCRDFPQSAPVKLECNLCKRVLLALMRMIEAIYHSFCPTASV